MSLDKEVTEYASKTARSRALLSDYSGAMSDLAAAPVRGAEPPI